MPSLQGLGRAGDPGSPRRRQAGPWHGFG